MAVIRTFRDLRVWQEAHKLVLEVYRLSVKFPSYELYGLTAQLRRAILSVAANVVEGFHRRTVQESIRFYNIADASLEETRYELIVARDLGYVSQKEYDDLESHAGTVSKLLHGWIESQKHNRSIV